MEITELIFCKYFAGPKMMGNIDSFFFESLNQAFICLVVSAMCHCLKAWRTGIFEQPDDFQYETALSKYQFNMACRKANRARNLYTILAHVGYLQATGMQVVVGYNKD